MNFKTRALADLRTHRAAIAQKHCLAGFDGFVDTIVAPVAQRAGQGENFTAFTSLAGFGQRIVDAAGKSTNIELYPRMDKLGGNGPIMANAVLAHGARVTYVGALGRGAVHPVFADLAARARVVSITDAAHTIAVECPDGKIMLGMMRCLDEVTPDSITAALGGLDAYRAALASADLVALVNWTMLPHMTAIFADLVTRVLPGVPAREGRTFFFDLADPEKRARADLVQALETIAQFGRFGRVTLGLNFKESQQVFAALGFPAADKSEAGLRHMAAEIRARLDVATVVIHPTESAACATRDGTWWVPGPYCEQPLITTGAGDHFNAGFTTGQLLGLAPESCLALGVSTSGHYVRTAQSPSLADLETFLANWR
jgi:sugar/nucleoside kinase (ribokinase family)